MKKLFLLLLLIGLLSSCKKDQEIIAPSETTENSSTLLDEKTSPGGETKGLSSTILNASNANQIPSQMFAVNPIYKAAYIHMGQPDGSSCSWTSYMLAVGSIARGNGSSYECSSDKVYRIKSKCLEINSNNSKLITTLRSFGNMYDKTYITAIYEYGEKNSVGRFTAIKKMLAYIYAYHTPFLVIGTHYYTNGSKGAHYLVVHSIDWKVGGTGSTIYYTDCAFGCVNNNCSLQSNLRSMSLTTFLDRMIESSNLYNMLFFIPK